MLMQPSPLSRIYGAVSPQLRLGLDGHWQREIIRHGNQAEAAEQRKLRNQKTRKTLAGYLENCTKYGSTIACKYRDHKQEASDKGKPGPASLGPGLSQQSEAGKRDLSSSNIIRKVGTEHIGDV